MFPLRDSIPSRRFPAVTLTLIVANVAVFLVQLAVPEPAILRWALVPARVVAAVGGGGDPVAAAATLFTSMFLHGSLFHVGGNVWFLWVFGDNVEDRFGRLGFLVFYLCCGLVAGAAEVGFSPGSTVPVVGASGAIAGVLGAYIRFYPGARILAVVPIFIFLQFVEVPAAVFLGLWFVLQFVSQWLGAPGVAWWAHILGFGAGLVLSFVPTGPRRPALARRLRR